MSDVETKAHIEGRRHEVAGIIEDELAFSSGSSYHFLKAADRILAALRTAVQRCQCRECCGIPDGIPWTDQCCTAGQRDIECDHRMKPVLSEVCPGCNAYVEYTPPAEQREPDGFIVSGPSDEYVCYTQKAADKEALHGGGFIRPFHYIGTPPVETEPSGDAWTGPCLRDFPPVGYCGCADCAAPEPSGLREAMATWSCPRCETLNQTSLTPPITCGHCEYEGLKVALTPTEKGPRKYAWTCPTHGYFTAPEHDCPKCEGGGS